MPTMGVTMHEVLKFPLQSVRRSTDNRRNKHGSAKILLFTGVRYERHIQDEVNPKPQAKEVAEKL